MCDQGGPEGRVEIDVLMCIMDGWSHWDGARNFF